MLGRTTTSLWDLFEKHFVFETVQPNTITQTLLMMKEYFNAEPDITPNCDCERTFSSIELEDNLCSKKHVFYHGILRFFKYHQQYEEDMESRLMKTIFHRTEQRKEHIVGGNLL